MGHVYETNNIAHPEDKTRDMNSMRVHGLQAIYKEFKIGFEVNDGRFFQFIDDREAGHESGSKQEGIH